MTDKIKQLNNYYNYLLKETDKHTQLAKAMRETGDKEAALILNDERNYYLLQLNGFETALEILQLEHEIENWRWDVDGNLRRAKGE